MNYLLCRNRVRNFAQWKRVFDSHAAAHGAAGLKLVHLWYELDSPRHVFFLFEVEDIARARAFLDSPDATASAHESGLIEGDFRFFSESLGYGPLNEAESRAFAATTESVAIKDAKDSLPSEAADNSVSPEPVKSPELGRSTEAEKEPTPAESAKTAEPTTTEPEKISTPPAAMKGPERAMPLELVDGWEPVENWPPAEAAAEAHEPSGHRRRWERTKY